MWLFNIPGIGQIAISARNKEDAIRAVQTEIMRRGFPVEATEIGEALDQGSRVPSPNIPGSATILDPVQYSDGSGGVTEVDGGGGNSGGGGGVVDNPGVADPNNDVRSVTGMDISSVPFGTFANALMTRGLSPEGVLGNTISQAFNSLSQAASIGALTGTANIGDQPGDLQRFFESRLGTGSQLSADVFRDLRSGRAAAGLDGDNSLALDQFRAPDFSSPAGRSSAAQVFDLGRSAARNRFGGLAASLLPSNTALSRRFEQPLALGQQPDFLEFVSSQFGI